MSLRTWRLESLEETLIEYGALIQGGMGPVRVETAVNAMQRVELKMQDAGRVSRSGSGC